MDALPVFLRLAGARVLLVGSGPAAAAKARLIEGAGGIVVADLPAAIAFVALADATEAEREATRLRAAGLLVNVVDRPGLCDFTVPAIVDRSPVIVAVGTGAASASLAKALRERLEALLPASLGRLAAAILAARAAVARRAPTIDARRRLWDAALAPGGPLDPLAAHDDADAAVAQVVAVGSDAAPANSVTEIVLTSPDPDDLTLRQLRALNQADTIYHDPGVPPAILDRARRDAVRVTGPVPGVLPAGRSVVIGVAAGTDPAGLPVAAHPAAAEPLVGGRVTAGVVRIGETVRRPVAGDRSFQHSCLRHLERVGFDAAPRYLGGDGAGREMLSFIPGEVPADLGNYDDTQLGAAAALLRRFHDATADLGGLRERGLVACHNDWAPTNAVFRHGLPVALIDFDTLAPGLRLWDLGYSAFTWLDLGHDDYAPAEQLRRLAVFADGYGVAGATATQIAVFALARQSALAASAAARDLTDIASWAAAAARWTALNLVEPLLPTGYPPPTI